MGQVAFSADGKVLAAAVSSTSRLGTDPTIQVWEVATGRVRSSSRYGTRVLKVGRRAGLNETSGLRLLLEGTEPLAWPCSAQKLFVFLGSLVPAGCL